jgi:hypothetical protein
MGRTPQVHRRGLEMSTDIREITDRVEGVAFGAANAAAKVAADPMGTVRKQMKGLERRGTRAAHRVNRRLNARIGAAAVPARDAFKTISGTPEKYALRGLRLVKVQARRPDMMGEVAKNALRFFHGSFKTIARVATRLEAASELTPRVAPKAVTTRRPARRARARRAA